MRIFYEKLTEPVENYYDNKSTLENVLYLEDIPQILLFELFIKFVPSPIRKIHSLTIFYY